MQDLIQKMITYMSRHGDRIAEYTLEHIELIFLSVTISFGISLVLVAVIRHVRFLEEPLNALCNTIFAVPTMAMFALLIPLSGLGKDTAVITLVLYNLFIFVKNLNQAFNGIDQNVVEAACGMGMNPLQVLVSVKLPLALPTILGGIKMSLIATLTMATLAANIGGGGLGILLFHGLAMKKWNQVAWGIVISLLMGIAISVIMQYLENLALNRSRGIARS